MKFLCGNCKRLLPMSKAIVTGNKSHTNDCTGIECEDCFRKWNAKNKNGTWDYYDYGVPKVGK